MTLVATFEPMFGTENGAPKSLERMYQLYGIMKITEASIYS
jgi:hypothetical protein